MNRRTNLRIIIEGPFFFCRKKYVYTCVWFVFPLTRMIHRFRRLFKRQSTWHVSQKMASEFCTLRRSSPILYLCQLKVRVAIVGGLYGFCSTFNCRFILCNDAGYNLPSSQSIMLTSAHGMEFQSNACNYMVWKTDHLTKWLIGIIGIDC